MPVVRTDGRAGGRSVYSHVITKFSRMGSLPHFLTHGAPLRALRARELRYENVYLIRGKELANNILSTDHLFEISRLPISKFNWISAGLLSGMQLLQTPGRTNTFKITEEKVLPF